MTDALGTASAIRIRAAQPTDAAVLTRLALSSKAVWGYDASFMAACRAELTITPESIARQPTHVIERHGQALGFYQLRIDGAVARIAQFFIAPAMLRRGIGRHLWAHLLATALAAGMTRLEVDSDPHAEAFYLTMGMRRIGAAPSGSIAGRMLRGSCRRSSKRQSLGAAVRRRYHRVKCSVRQGSHPAASRIRQSMLAAVS